MHYGGHGWHSSFFGVLFPGSGAAHPRHSTESSPGRPSLKEALMGLSARRATMKT
ncbi:hypothetical protein CVCC1112_316 [Paenarthrobacter nicotinovorans]|nr:hypothetical protein CVCC1112_316 [Paenarthrobacter nicotinovorans]